MRVCPPNLAPKAAADKFLWPSSRRLSPFKYGLLHAMRYADVLHTVPLFGAIAVRNRYDRKLSLRAGRIWQRIHLFATARGFAGAPCNELVELVDHQRLRGQPAQAAAALSTPLIGARRGSVYVPPRLSGVRGFSESSPPGPGCAQSVTLINDSPAYEGASGGGRLTTCSTESFARKAAAQLPSGLERALEPMLKTIEALTEQIGAYDRVIDELASRYPATEVLRQVTGVGALTAVAYALTLGDSSRFGTSRDIGAFLGLVPSQHDSGNDVSQLSITKAGNTLLRRLLVGSAPTTSWAFRGRDCDLRRYGERLMSRRGRNAKKRANVAVAWELAVLLAADYGWAARFTIHFIPGEKIARQRNGSKTKRFQKSQHLTKSRVHGDCDGIFGQLSARSLCRWQRRPA